MSVDIGNVIGMVIVVGVVGAVAWRIFQDFQAAKKRDEGKTEAAPLTEGTTRGGEGAVKEKPVAKKSKKAIKKTKTPKKKPVANTAKKKAKTLTNKTKKKAKKVTKKTKKQSGN